MSSRYGPKHIYGLVDPTSGEVHYVGASHDPEVRYGQHLSSAAGNSDAPFKVWIRGLRAQGLSPRLQIFTDAPVEDWAVLERETQNTHASTLLSTRSGAIQTVFSPLEIGETLTLARTSAGFSQAYVAKEMGVAQATVSRWESGSRIPQLSTFYTMASMYGTTVAQLLPNSQSKGAVADLARARKGTNGN